MTTVPESEQAQSRVTTQPPSFPRQRARTQRFTLGVPKAFAIAPDGSRVVFLRSPHGTDPATGLWVLDVDAPRERQVADPRALLGGSTEQLSPEERARRERLREGAAGIVGFATDDAVQRAAFALSGRLYVADLVSGRVTGPLSTATPVVDPRPDPTGERIAYAANGELRVVDVAATADHPVASPDGDAVTWGVAEFVAAEEMDRLRGFWWAPDGSRLLVARVDEAPVQRWHLADPSTPDLEPAVVRYPAAGTPNAEVTLWLVDLDGNRVEVRWDRQRLPYVVTASWSDHTRGGCTVVVQSRDQRTMQLLRVDQTTGATALVAEDTDPQWLEIVPGVPSWLSDGRRIATSDDRSCDTRRLTVDGVAVTAPGLQVRAVLDADDDVLFTASEEPTEQHLYAWSDRSGVEQLSAGAGWHSGRGRGDVRVVVSQRLAAAGVTVMVMRDSQQIATIPSYAETPVLTPRVTMLRTGERELQTAVLFPDGHVLGSRKLPVLLDPYGGPGAQRVVSAAGAFLASQWLADQGFAVIVADGRGTPGRGPAWERSIAFDVAGPVLDDQLAALQSAAQTYPDDLDLDRVGITGWSFGGYLAALAVLRRPDAVHAAVAGAPCTDWSLYDTHYTERYLGLPQERPEVYAATSLLDDAPKLERPLLLIHGLADDNVVAAHTLRLSSALLAAGRPHTVLPLSGVTHMTPQEVVAENLLLLQVQFLRDALGLS